MRRTAPANEGLRPFAARVLTFSGGAFELGEMVLAGGFDQVNALVRVAVALEGLGRAALLRWIWTRPLIEGSSVIVSISLCAAAAPRDRTTYKSVQVPLKPPNFESA